MANMTMVQARTTKELKTNAADILDKLGLNLSTYINMALNQLVINEGIPFEVRLNSSPYTKEEAVNEVAATLRMEGMQLTKEDLGILNAYKNGQVSGEELRARIMNEI